MARPFYGIHPFSCASIAVILAWSLNASETADAKDEFRKIAPPNDVVIQYPAPQARRSLVQVTSMIRVDQARTQYSVDGTGLTAVVLDTGLRTTHVDFVGKVLTQKNYTSDNGGDVNNAADGEGHGTNVAGIICARGIHTGIAPGAKVIPMKVLSNTGGGSFNSVDQALAWVIANKQTYNISVVNMSLGDSGNYTSDSAFANDAIRLKIAMLRSLNVVVCVAAGNDFFEKNSAEGMSYPAIFRETVSVGAVFDGNLGRVDYGGPTAFTTAAGRITPFSQRLHLTTNSLTRTDILAPGAAITSSGHQSDQGESTSHGTSQATPVVAGLVLLAQQYWLRQKGALPTVDQLETWLRHSKTLNIDGDDEDDNVNHNNKQYVNADALDMFDALIADTGTTNPPPPPPPTTSNVNVGYDRQTKTLLITGDDGANAIAVSLSRSRIRVKGLNGTSINAQTSDFTASMPRGFSISIDAAGGDDAISVTGTSLLNLNVNMGSGADSFRLSYSTVNTLKLDGGSEVDTFLSIGNKISNRTVTGIP